MNNITITTRLTYLARIITVQEDVREVDDRNVHRDAVQAPGRAMAFYYADVAFGETTINGETVTLHSNPFNQSKTYYIDGEAYAVDDIVLNRKYHSEESEEETKHYLKKMGYEFAIHCRQGNWEPFNPAVDEVVTTK